MRRLVRRKWRPSLALVVTAVLGMVLCLPLAGLVLVNFYGKQLVQQTEETLIGQAAVLSAQFADEFRRAGGDATLGRVPEPGEKQVKRSGFDPIFPTLSLKSSDILPPRLDPLPAFRPPTPVYEKIGERLTRISKSAQLRTLAGYRAIDPFGRVIGGSGEVGYDLGHVAEVREALSGRTATVLRQRISDTPTPPVWSISRRSKVRVFVALPVMVEGRVIGAVYLSRTPGNVVQYLYQERQNLLRVISLVVLAAGVIGVVFWRFVTRPLGLLITQSRQISEGGRDAAQPLLHYGTREVAELGQGLLSMSEALSQRGAEIETFTNHVTHELKSPITSIRGAIELLRDPGAPMSAERQQRFFENIEQDVTRMNALLERLRSLTRARSLPSGGHTTINSVITEIRQAFEPLDIVVEGGDERLPMSAEVLLAVLEHLIQNAQDHGADSIEITAGDGPSLNIRDNGKGISAANRTRIFEPFFTTRRQNGGTGMGLGIVEAMVSASGGQISLTDHTPGTEFLIRFQAG